MVFIYYVFQVTSTHLLQPLDVYTFKYLKQEWKSLLWEELKKRSDRLDKREFIKLFSKLYDHALIPSHCSAAFAKAGVFPFDSRAINTERIVKNGTSSSLLSKTTATQLKLHPTSLTLNKKFSNIDGTSTMEKRKLVRSTSAPVFVFGKFLITLC